MWFVGHNHCWELQKKKKKKKKKSKKIAPSWEILEFCFKKKNNLRVNSKGF